MSEAVITTRVDDLVLFLKGKGKVALEDVAKALQVELDVLQAWVDFLVEEGVLGIEYKFTKPYIFVIEEKKGRAKIIHEEDVSWESYKKEYLAAFKKKGRPETEALAAWQHHVHERVTAQKRYFTDQLRKRQLADEERLWKLFLKHVASKT